MGKGNWFPPIDSWYGMGKGGKNMGKGTGEAPAPSYSSKAHKAMEEKRILNDSSIHKQLMAKLVAHVPKEVLEDLEPEQKKLLESSTKKPEQQQHKYSKEDIHRKRQHIATISKAAKYDDRMHQYSQELQEEFKAMQEHAWNEKPLATQAKELQEQIDKEKRGCVVSGKKKDQTYANLVKAQKEDEAQRALLEEQEHSLEQLEEKLKGINEQRKREQFDTITLKDNNHNEQQDRVLDETEWVDGDVFEDDDDMEDPERDSDDESVYNEGHLHEDERADTTKYHPAHDLHELFNSTDRQSEKCSEILSRLQKHHEIVEDRNNRTRNNKRKKLAMGKNKRGAPCSREVMQGKLVQVGSDRPAASLEAGGADETPAGALGV